MTKQELYDVMVEADIDLTRPLPFGDENETVEDFYKIVIADCLRDRAGVARPDIVMLCKKLGIISGPASSLTSIHGVFK